MLAKSRIPMCDLSLVLRLVGYLVLYVILENFLNT